MKSKSASVQNNWMIVSIHAYVCALFADSEEETANELSPSFQTLNHEVFRNFAKFYLTKSKSENSSEHKTDS